MILGNRTIVILFLICFYAIGGLYSQEVLYNVISNRALIDNSINRVEEKNNSSKYLVLPIIDDFSGNSIYPDTNIWSDRYVYLNNTFCVNPNSYGVATFDGLDEYGRLYEWLSSGSSVADYLTSLPIRMDSASDGNVFTKAYAPEDSIYLSFEYQPGGNGNSPESDDKLVLEFYSPTRDKWDVVWESEGKTFDKFKEECNCDFKRVYIPLTDTSYLKKGFRFRFYNYVSLTNNLMPSWASTNDNWNIDYVYLAEGRHNGDSIDDAAILGADKILKGYTSVPLRHFDVDLLSDSLRFSYKINGNSSITVGRQFIIRDISKKENIIEVLQTPVTSLTSEAGMTEEYDEPNTYNFLSNIAVDSATFEVVSIINSTDKIESNNKYIDNVRLWNYYSYDDGSAERGWGLTNVKNGKFAYKFDIRKQDTLRGISIFFNNVKDEANVKYFYLCVWKSLFPEQLVYKKNWQLPKSGESIGGFSYYMFNDTDFVIDNSYGGVIYIGIIQKSEESLNIGFDMNNDAMSKLYVNVNNIWENSKYKGALMIRPIFGKRVDIPSGIGIRSPNNYFFNIYPNPVTNGKFFIDTDFIDKEYHIYIYDLYGRIVYGSVVLRGNCSIDVNLSSGVYFSKIICDDEVVSVKKLVVR